MKKLLSASRPLGVINPAEAGWFPANSITNLTLSHARLFATDFVEGGAFCPSTEPSWPSTGQIYRPSNKTASKDNST